MAIRYAQWRDVVAKFRQATEVVPVVADQEQLLTEKTAVFRSYTRNVRRAALTPRAAGEYDELAREVVACMVAGELEHRANADASELRELDYGFVSGGFTTHEATAWSHIRAIKNGDAVFDEDPALRDILLPEPVGLEANTSTGHVLPLLPYAYKARVPGVFRVKCTTAGRIDTGTARFAVYFQEGAAAPEIATLVPSVTPQHIRNEFYLAFRDGAIAGDSFAVNDEWSVTVYPPDTRAQGRGPKPFQCFPDG